MDFSILIQVIVAGLATGGIYGLIALGFVLIYKATSVLNLAMGEFMTLGAFICFTALTMIHVPFWIAFAITIVFAIVLRYRHRTSHFKTADWRAHHFSDHGDHRIGRHPQRPHVYDLGSYLSGFPTNFFTQALETRFRRSSLRPSLGFHFCCDYDNCFHLNFQIFTYRCGHEGHSQ